MAITWLHLSDLHACPRDGWESDEIVGKLVDDLKRLADSRKLVPDLIFFTGDAAWGNLPGKLPIKEQFDLAHSFLESVRRVYGEHVPRENVFLVPGNHDVDRAQASKLAKSFLAGTDLEGVTELIRDGGQDWRGVVQRLDAYRDFVDKCFPHLLTNDHDRERLIYSHLREVGGKKIGIAGFNTAWSCSGDGEKARLWMAGDYQRGVLRQGLKTADFKIALLHHPPNWFGQAEDPAILRNLQADFQLLLHGHEHADWVDERPGFLTISSGACYARSDRGEKVGYSVTRLEPDQMRAEIHLRQWDASGGGWVARAVAGRTGDDGVFHADLPWLNPNAVTQAQMAAATSLKVATPAAVLAPALDPAIVSYLERLRLRSSCLPLLGFGKRAVQINISLDDVYIALDAELNRSVFEDELKSNRGPRRGPEPSGIRGPIAFDQALDLARDEFKLKALVILGQPGSGKTTLLKHFVLAASAERPGARRLGLPADTVTVLLELRALSHRAQGLRLALAEALLPPGTVKESPNFEASWREAAALATRLIDQQRLLILVDGLDEIASVEERLQVVKWLRQAATEWQHTLVVTSRFQGYHGKIHLGGQFLELHIRDLDQGRASRFIEDWYCAVERGLRGQSDPDAEREARSKAAGLVQHLFDPHDSRAEPLRRLVRNPLMLQIVCLVHRAQKNLPERRAELFNDCIDILLEFWLEGKDLPVTFRRSEALELLRPLSWSMQLEGKKQVDRSTLLTILEPFAEKQGLRRAQVLALIDAVRDQSGLLIEPEDGVVEFLHSSFQEYLAACHVQWMAAKAPQPLERLAAAFAEAQPGESWREVILLTVALDRGPLFTPLLRLLLKGRLLHKNPSLTHDLGRDTVDRSAVAVLEFLAEPASLDVRDEVLASLSLLKVLGQGWQSEGVGELSGWQVVESLVKVPESSIRNLAAELCGFSQEVIVTLDRPEPGAERRHEKDGSVLVWVPPGDYWLGDERQWSGDKNTPYAWEGPEHQVRLEGFWIGKYPVTCSQYRLFLDADPTNKAPEEWKNSRFNGAEQPVVGVDWFDATAYCRWAGLDLPSEAQWEAAARGGKKWRFPWGESDPTERHANFANQLGKTSPVGAYPLGAGPFGTLDQAGNVWEWCRDEFELGIYKGHYVDPRSGLSTNVDKRRQDLDKKGKVSDADRVLRGGSWAGRAGFLRAAYRSRLEPSYRYQYFGFRVVLVSAPEPFES